MTTPMIGITMGDPAGIGPEICLLSLSNQSVRQSVRPILIGDLARLEEARNLLISKRRLLSEGPPLRGLGMESLDDVDFTTDAIHVLDLGNVPPNLEWGTMNPAAGGCSFDYLKTAVDLAMSKKIAAIATAPINKEAWKLSGVSFPGHTEALAALSGSARSAMMLVNAGLRVVHVTTHVSLRQAIDLATTERILATIALTIESLQGLGLSHPKLAVAGLNPHAGEAGLFGSEDELRIRPAVEQARAKGWNVTGPYPPDSVFARGASGEFDAVIALYHDQGHIAIKMIGMDTGINVTLGLPFLRTSVDHGTAFDIAGQGIARETSMIKSIELAAEFLRR